MNGLLTALCALALAGEPGDRRGRPATVIAPEAPAPDERFPVVFAFHGRGADPARMVELWAEVARRERFVLVVPHLQDELAWYRGRKPGLPFADHFDLGIFDDLLAQVSSEHPTDASRVFAAGFSLGGMYSHQLLCDRADRLTAIAAVGATAEAGQVATCPGEPRPVMHVQGSKDRWQGARLSWKDLTGVFVSVPDHVAWLSARNRCQKGESRGLPNPANDGTTSTLEDHRCEGPPLRTVRIQNGGHFWPGSPVEQPGVPKDFSGAELIWAFFEGIPPR